MSAADTRPDDHSCRGRFTSELLSHSISESWHEARREWVHDYSIRNAPGGRCLCGKRITERCIIRNTKTGVRLTSGNRCVLRFDSLEMSAGVGAFTRNLAQLEANGCTAWANDPLLRAGLRYGLFSVGQASIYTSLRQSKRRLTNKQHQLKARLQINVRLVTAFCNKPKLCPHGCVVLALLGSGSTPYFKCRQHPYAMLS